jgi:hypothetical protein
MSVDLSKFLKDVIRGTIVDFDIPAVPIALDERGEAIECSREELKLFFRLVDEVRAETGPDSRLSIAREIAALRQEHLGANRPKDDVDAGDSSSWRLLDKDGALAMDPDIVALVEWRYADGKVEVFPFKWTIPGVIGHGGGLSQ